MQPLTIVCRGVNGAAVVNSTATLYFQDGATPIPNGFFFKADGITAMPNPTTTDSAGRIQMVGPDGKYVASVATPSGAAITPFQLFDPSGAAPNVIADDNYTFMLGDEITGVNFTYAAGCQATIPPDGFQNFNVGAIIPIESQGSQPCQIVAGAGVTLNPSTSSATARIQFSVIAIKKNAANNWTIFGDVQ